MKTLMKHQEDGLAYAKTTRNPAFLLEMRLGKTLTALRWLKSVTRPNATILVLAPKSVLPAWKAELQDDGFTGIMLEPKGSTARKFGIVTEHIKLKGRTGRLYVFLNYEVVTHCPSILEYCQWDAIICDESTKIRNPKAFITKHLCSLTEHVPYKAILSGLPAPESQMDYFSQFVFLDGQFMGHDNFWRWRNAFFTCFDGFTWHPKPGVTERIKKVVQERAFIRTRKQCGIGSKKIYECRYLDMTPKQKKVYKQAETEFMMELKGKTIETKWVPVTYEWLTQICGGIVAVHNKEKKTISYEVVSSAKVEELASLLEGELKGEKVIIWFKHNAELFMVEKELKKRGFNVGVFTSARKCGTNESGTLKDDLDVMCAQSKCGLFGLDWSKASTAIYYSNWYDSEVRHQTEDRICHPKKHEPVLYIDLLTKDSIDEDVWTILMEKKINSRYSMVDLFNKLKERKTK